MPYIKYDAKTKKFFATKKRPTNQSTSKILKKIAKRLAKYVLQHPDTELTELQEKFIKGIKNFKAKNKKGEKFSLKKEKMDIVHGVAISMIIRFFVKILNKPKSLNLKKANKFSDAILSTVSSDDDKGRSTLNDFWGAIKNGDDPDDLCSSANEILKILNCSTRNLSVGHASVNRFIGKAEDPLLIKEKNGPGFFKMAPAKNISKNYKKLPECDDYAPKTKETKKGQTALASSSVFSKKENSYIVRSNPDSDSDSDSDTIYKVVPAKQLK